MSRKEFYKDNSIEDLKKFFWANEGLFIIIIIIISVSLFIFYSSKHSFILFDGKLKFNDLESILWQYSLLIIAIERSAAVIVGNSRRQSNINWSLRIKRLSETLSKEDPHLNILKQVYNRELKVLQKLESEEVISKIERVKESASDTNTDYYIGFLLTAKHAYEFQQAKHNSITDRYITRIVFLIGIILASFGLSFLSQVINNYDDFYGIQKVIIKLLDIFITGGLLGGGSSGLSLISNKISESIKPT
ncbi:hypothetical protein [Photobacterium kasasachensis]|uniref:hypothetical protein n=1 Tax=Photobacterium kasasachensis TaxID=2910240 RepID=UPI003D0E2CFB